ncbi:MAG: carboxypeptidase regulatory-like domain-containing protein, partial [Gemmatimonadota bacterium]|nr:carboxypeptidase regulatory-like domain-containing protein [Gemmatimonadota bacterium]
MFFIRSHNLPSRFFLCVSLVLVNPEILNAQSDSTARLAGVVLAQETRQPLAGATIDLNPGTRTTRSDQRGMFRFEALPPGLYTLTVRMLGRTVNETQVEVVARTMGLEILLDRSAYVLPPIEVLRSRTELARGLDDIPGSVQVIGRVESLKLNPLGDVHETLRMAPGVQVQDEEGFGLRPNIG